MKGGIVIDTYKLDVFARRLKEAGFAFMTSAGPTFDTLVISVEVDEGEIQRLGQLCLAANTEASNAKQ